MNIGRSLFAGLVAVAAIAGAAAASTPTSVSPDFGDTSPSSITVVLTCKIVNFDPADGKIVLRDLASGSEAEIQLGDGIKLKARNKKDFGGRKKLTFRDLRADQEVKVTINRLSGEITRITVLKATAA